MDVAIPDEINEPKVRPTGVSVIAILALIGGVFNFCYSPFGIAHLLLMDAPANVAMRNDPTIYYTTVVGGAMGWFISILTISLGIGLWRTKEWARVWTVYYCIGAAIWTLIGGAFYVIYITPKAMKIGMEVAQAQSKVQSPMPADLMNNIILGTMIFTGLVMLVFCAAYIFIAVYMSKATTKEAFKPY